jgi:hypothetical protein
MIYYSNCFRAVAHIVKSLVTSLEVNDTKSKNQIGCISPYKKQVVKLNEELRQKIGNKWRNFVSVNTVDSFQVIETNFLLPGARERRHRLLSSQSLSQSQQRLRRPEPYRFPHRCQKTQRRYHKTSICSLRCW